ncbi:MAG: thioredoxin [Bacteroidetes bacterium]|nr:thioredoxin [Bacteroidota bacterium]
MGSKFKEMIEGEVPTLVDFYADWCAPCKAMKPVLEEVKSKLGDKTNILKIDVDNNPSVSKVYSIRGVPTFILFKKGKIVWRASGVMSSNELESVILQNI